MTRKGKLRRAKSTVNIVRKALYRLQEDSDGQDNVYESSINTLLDTLWCLEMRVKCYEEYLDESVVNTGRQLMKGTV